MCTNGCDWFSMIDLDLDMPFPITYQYMIYQIIKKIHFIFDLLVYNWCLIMHNCKQVKYLYCIMLSSISVYFFI